MHDRSISRRSFLKGGTALAAGLAALSSPWTVFAASRAQEPIYRISLAQWSLHRAFFDGELDPLDFPVHTREAFGIEAVEYVNQFYTDQVGDDAYWQELKSRAEGEGVKNLLIMCDGEGRLGDPDEAARREAVENHHKWVERAAFLDCHSIRVNAASEGDFEEQQKLAADGLRRLGEFADDHDINVIVENHGGLSSNGEWLAGTIQQADHPRVGTLPDFGNFQIDEDEEYDRYEGVRELMPFAKGVSAKSHDFDEEGNETNTDYFRMMRIVLDAGYRGYVGIEYEGDGLSEPEGIRATNQLLERVRDELTSEYAEEE